MPHDALFKNGILLPNICYSLLMAYYFLGGPCTMNSDCMTGQICEIHTNVCTCDAFMKEFEVNGECVKGLGKKH